MPVRMKTLTLSLALLLLGAFQSTFAQQDKGKKGKAKEETKKTELQGATEKLAANIKKALAAFRDINKPAPEKVKEFNGIITEIETALNLVERNGELHGEVQSAVKLALDKARKYKEKAKASDTPDEFRKDYEELSVKFEVNARKAGIFMVAIIETRLDLGTQLVYVKKNREYYIAMIEADQLEKANKVLAKVVLNMNEVAQALLNLGVKNREFYQN